MTMGPARIGSVAFGVSAMLAVCLAAATAVAGDGDIRVEAGKTQMLSAAPSESITKTGFGTLETDFDFTGKFALEEGTWRLKGGSTVVCDGSPVNETSWFYVKGAKDSMLAPAEGAYIEVTDGSSLTVKGVSYIGLGDRYFGGSNRTRGYGSIVVTGGSFLDLAPSSQVRLTDFGSVGGTAILAISNSTAAIRKPMYLPPTEHADNSAKFIVSGSSVSVADIVAQGVVEKNGAWFDAATLTPLAASTNWLSSGAKTPASYYRILAGGLTVNAACDVTIPESGVLSGPGGLVKTGARTLTLAAANTYEGTTTVREGTLEVTGALMGPLELAGGTLALGGGAAIPRLAVSAKGALTLNGDGVTVGAASGYDGRLQVTATNLGRYGVGTVLVRSGDAAFLDWLRRNLLTRIAVDLDLVAEDGALTLVRNPAGEAAVGGVVGRVSFTDGLECWQNPGCGHAGGGWSTLEKDKYVDVRLRSPNQTKLWSLQKFSKGYLYNNNPTHYEKAMHYCGGADIPLNAYALESISNAFESCRAAGGTVIPRFAYTWDGFGGCEPDDFEMILTHIRQLAALCSQYRDVIPAVECGTIGAYGEMHTSRYCDREHARRITSAWLDGLPDDMAFLVRSPCYVIYEAGAENTTEFLLSGVADSPRIRRVGFYNDGYLGTDGDYGTWGSGGASFTRAQGRAYLRSRGNVPYGGEFATVTDAYFEQNVHLLDVSRFNLVEEWYDTHLSYLRTIRTTNMTVWQKLEATAFDSAKWAFDNMPYLAEYDGQTLQKFCEDHMGYRYVVRGIEARRRGREVKLELKIENTGFGRLCFPETKEIVLSDGPDQIVLPATGTDLRLLEGGRTTAVEVGFTLPEGIPLGRYHVALRERVPLSDEDGTGLPRRAIAFANEGSYDAATKANYLGIIRIDGTTDTVTAEDHSSGGTVMVAPDKVADLRNVTFTEGARLVVAGGGRVVLGRSVPALVEIENGRLEFSSWPAGFDPASVIAHGNAVTLRNDDATAVAINLADHAYDGFGLEGNFRYVVPAGTTVTLDAQRWIADFGIDVYGTLDVRADLVLAGSVDATVHSGGTMGNLGRDATSGPGKMIVRDRARIVVRKGGLLLNPVNGNWNNSGLELMTQVEGATSLVLDGGTVAVHRMSGTGKGKIEVRSDSEWDVWYGAWYGEHRPPSPFKGASEVEIADGATLTMTRIRQDFGSNQQDGGDITVRLADVHVTGFGDLRFANAHPTRKVAFEIVAANDCTGEVSLEEGAGATLTFLSGSSWGGDIVMTPGVVIPEDWWFSANAATGACYGGAWQGRDDFAVAEPAGAAYDAVMSFSGVAGWMGELPERHGIVSFLFLEDGEGALRPYGWTAEGWVALAGKDFAEGVTFELEVDFRFRKGAWTVGFTADGAALADERGRVRFPVDYDPGALRRIVFDGPGRHGDFRGRLLCRRVPGFKVIIR